jgi:hypothetical protein
MAKKSRVLYTGKGCELFIETDGLNERLVFNSFNNSGFSGLTLSELETNANAIIASAKNLLAMLDDLKDITHDKAPAMLGYQNYVSPRELKKKMEEDKMDNVLKSLKPYLKGETTEGGDAI